MVHWTSAASKPEKDDDRRMVKTVTQSAAGCSANTAVHLDLQYHDWKWDGSGLPWCDSAIPFHDL